MNFDSLFLRLADERKKLGLTQAEAGSACGVSREMWSRYEKGKASMGSDVLALFAVAGADVAYILTGVRAVPPQLSSREAALLDNYRHCPDDAQRNVEGMVSLLAQPKIVKKKAG
jgi:transcriptional regulator with XRE-family HTH domain